MTESSGRLLAKQQQLQRLIDRSLDNFKKIGRSNLTPAKIRSRVASLKENWLQFLNGHAELMKTISETSQASISYFKDNVFEATQEVYQATLDFMAECLEELEPPVSPNQSGDFANIQSGASAFSLSHLPPMNLPPFDGSFDKWEHFRDRFTGLIIHNKDLRNFMRMHYLMSCLKGSALDFIKDIPITAENFELAWKALTARYENKRRLLGVHLSALLNLPNISRESASDLHALLDKVSFSLASLNHLHRSAEELWHDQLVHLITIKLDSATRKAWNLKSSDADDPPSFDDLVKFLTARARALEEFSTPVTSKSHSKSFGNSTCQRISTSTAASSGSVSPSSNVVPSIPCSVCKARHYFSTCPSFVKGNTSQRRDLVKQHNRCFNCLSAGHLVRDCKSKHSCRLCQQRHHSMLHTSSGVGSMFSAVQLSDGCPSPLASKDLPPKEPTPEVQTLIASSTRENSQKQVLLATVWVTLSGSSGHAEKVRALLDQGSQRTFISERAVQFLKLKRIRLPTSVQAVGDVYAGTFQFSSQIFISPVCSRSPVCTTTAVIMKKLTSYAPKLCVGIASLQHFRELTLADPDPTSSDPIDLILGADIYNDIILEGLRKGKQGDPIAQNTIFGWVLSGPITPSESCKETASSSIVAYHCLESSSLDEDLKKFWEVEEPPLKVIPSEADEICERHFLTTHSRANDGRYIVRLPFRKPPPIAIGDSRFQASKMLNSLLNRFRLQPELESDYREFMTEYENLGHMRKGPAVSKTQDTPVFIPHHPVIRVAS